MKPPLNVMLDLETLGTRPGCAIVQIGAVAFDLDGIHDEFCINVDLVDCQTRGLHFDAATLRWWLMKESAAGARRIFADPDKPLGDALCTFTGWYEQMGRGPIWGNGASFDLAILAAAYHAAHARTPWAYRDERCYRTLAALHPEIANEKSDVPHHALYDANAQAEHAVKILRSRMAGAADLLATTCASQRAHLQSQHELQRAQAALAAAHCPQGTAEELGDAICRLAGERDEARTALTTLRKSLQLPETASTGELLRVVLHLAAKHAAKQEAAQ